MWTSLQICWKVIGLCSATAPASSMAGPLLSLDEVAEALGCCWWDLWDPREPLEPRELYPWEPPLWMGCTRSLWICSLSCTMSGVVARVSQP